MEWELDPLESLIDSLEFLKDPPESLMDLAGLLIDAPGYKGPREFRSPEGEIMINVERKDISQMVRHPFRREENMGKRWWMSHFGLHGVSRIAIGSVMSELNSKTRAIQMMVLTF